MHAVSGTPHAQNSAIKKSNLEHEAEFKKALARESWAQGGLFDEKKPKIENLESYTVPLMMF
jgi:hypothetical protein